MQLDALISGLEVFAPGTGDDALARVRICDITEDSRTVMPGSLFVARRGEKSDGRAFVSGAIGAGAVAILTDDHTLKMPARSEAVLLVAPDLHLAIAQLAERFYGSPSSKLKVVGVTGTNGKTTITYLIHQLLNRAQVRCGMIGTVCIDDGVEVAPAALTTPPAMEVSRTMSRMVEAGCKACAMETSSHALHQRRVGATSFAVGVFTNLSHDHLDYHKTMDAYADAKAMLFESLAPEAMAIVNMDDPYAARMVRDCRARIVRCSMQSRRSASDPVADVAARVVSAGVSSTVIELMGPWVKGHGGRGVAVKLPLIGPHNVMNAMQAAACGWALGLSEDEIRDGLEHAHAPPGRLEPVTRPEHPLAVYVDYAHSDDSLKRVLMVLGESLKDQARATGKPMGKLSVVFGCGGDRDKTKRPKMGAIAATLADRVIVTSDNPRTEDAGAIIDQIMGGIPGSLRGKVVVESDRLLAINRAVKELSEGDVLLVAGKGHEDYQILPDGRGGTHKIHFDDREVSRAALAQRGIDVGEHSGTHAGKRPASKTAQRHKPNTGGHHG